MVQMLSMPAPSALRAMSAMIGPICLFGAGQEKLVTAMPIFITAAVSVVWNRS